MKDYNHTGVQNNSYIAIGIGEISNKDTVRNSIAGKIITESGHVLVKKQYHVELQNGIYKIIGDFSQYELTYDNTAEKFLLRKKSRISGSEIWIDDNEEGIECYRCSSDNLPRIVAEFSSDVFVTIDGVMVGEKESVMKAERFVTEVKEGVQ